MGQAPVSLAAGHGGGSGRGGPGNYTKLYTSAVDRVRSSPASFSAADAELVGLLHAAAEWRNLVRLMWVEMGRPQVPGFPASRVQQILWGELPPENGFFSGLLSAITSRSRAGVTAESWVHQGLLRVLETRESSPGVGVLTWDRVYDPESDHGADVVMVDPETNRVTAVQVKAICRVSTGAPLVLGSATADGSDHTPRPSWVETRSLFAAGPDPDAVETEAEFVAALRELKKRTGLSLRQIEERSKTTTAGWLARSSAADMLRRETLPRPDALWALTAALGLAKEDQDKWEAARSRLHKQRRTQRRLHSVPTEDGDPGLDEYHSQINDDLDAQTA